MKVRILSLIVVSTLAALCLCELGVRAAGYGQMMLFAPDPDLGYLMQSNQRVYVYGHPVSINSEGLRGPEPAPAAGDAPRVVFLGDSVTYGGGRIREEELFVRRVEASLQGDDAGLQAINISAPGWSPQNWIGFVEQRGLFDAEVVVAVIPEIDLLRPFSTMEMHRFRDHAPLLRLSGFASKAWMQVWGAPVSEVWERVDPAVEAQRNVAAVERLVDSAGSRGCAVVIALVPSAPPEVDASYWLPYERLAASVVDLRPVLVDEDYFIDGIHLSSAGHAIVAERLAPAVRAALESQ